jgi:hypothetical protein
VNPAPVPAGLVRRDSVPARLAGRIAMVVVAATVAFVAAACSTTPPSASQTEGPVAPSFAATADGATIEPPSSFGPPPSPTPPDDTVPLSIDPTLLEFLPESVDGIPVVEDPNEAAIALGNRSLDDLATALDAAVAVDAGTGNLVYALVVRLKPDALTDEGYRQWRDSYDEGVCSPNGGITGRAQADIGGRNTYVTSCVEGILSYHVLLEEQDILVSAWSLGEGRFGEKLLASLQVPE